jgi:hypothetical protein
MKTNVKFDPRDTETINRAIEIDNTLSAKFKPIFDRFNRNYNMMVADMQMPGELKERFKKDNRPLNAYNILAPVIKHLTSVERGGRKKVAALPRKESDLEMAQTVTKLIDCVHYNADLDYYKSRAFIDACICAWGWLQDMYVFDDDDPQGNLWIRSVNPMDLKFDMAYSDITLRQCRYVCYTPDLSLDEIVGQYGQDDKDLMRAILTEGNKYFPRDSKERKKFLPTIFSVLMDSLGTFFSGNSRYEMNENIRNEADWYNPLNGKFKIIELHERRTERRMMIFDPRDNSYKDITDDVVSENGYTEDDDKLQEAMKKYPNSPDPTWSNQKKIWLTTVIPALNLKVYDAPYAVQNGNFMFTPVFAYDFHADMTLTQSAIDELIDIQSEYNKTRSVMLEMLLRFSNLGYLVQEDAIKGFEEDFESRKIGGYKRVRNLDKIKPEEPPKIPAQLFTDMNEMRELAEYISGATASAAHGETESKNESGILFKQRKDSSMSMIQCLYDNLDTAHVQLTENSFANIQTFMTSERAFRITDDAEKPEFMTINQPQVMIDEKGQIITKILNDVTVGKYDFVMSAKPYGTTAREMAFLQLVDMFKFAIEADPQSAKQLFPIILKASDTPYRQEMLEALGVIGEAKEQQDKIKAAMQVLQQAFQQLQLDKGKAEVGEKQAKAHKLTSEATAQDLDNQGTAVKHAVVGAIGSRL